MGIGQLFKKREEPQEKENLRKVFESIKSQKIPSRTGKKVINFIYKSSCGCGSSSKIKCHAIVPEDYDDVQDGDIIDSLEDMISLEEEADTIYKDEYKGSVEDHNPDNYVIW